MFMAPHVRPNHNHTIQNGAYENTKNFRYSGNQNCMKEEIKGGLSSWKCHTIRVRILLSVLSISDDLRD